MIFSTRACSPMLKEVPFLSGANLGGSGLLKDGGKSIFEIMGQAGVFHVIYPNSAKMAIGWPTVT